MRLNKRSSIMKRITKITLFAIGLTILVSLAGVAPGFRPLAELLATAQADTDNIITFDVACDCRTGSPGFFAGKRGDVFIVNGKIFPAGTLPSGTATNDPTQPVNGVAPIGNWMCRGQNTFPFPAAVASAYASVPFALNTQYFILNDGRALTVEGYTIPTGELLSLTGGIGRFSGASGFLEEGPFGTNATGCPNFRAKFNIQPGSLRGESNSH
jgi:hypothetical protein